MKGRASAYPLKIFYDGSCMVCSGEMERYSRKDAAKRLVFIDIMAPDFRPEEYGKPREEFMRKLHVMDAQGRFYTGPDAFPVIWRALPQGRLYGFLTYLIEIPAINQLANAGYLLFARLRKYLPKRKPCRCG